MLPQVNAQACSKEINSIYFRKKIIRLFISNEIYFNMFSYEIIVQFQYISQLELFEMYFMILALIRVIKLKNWIRIYCTSNSKKFE